MYTHVNIQRKMRVNLLNLFEISFHFIGEKRATSLVTSIIDIRIKFLSFLAQLAARFCLIWAESDGTNRCSTRV